MVFALPKCDASILHSKNEPLHKASPFRAYAKRVWNAFFFLLASILERNFFVQFLLECWFRCCQCYVFLVFISGNKMHMYEKREFNCLEWFFFCECAKRNGRTYWFTFSTFKFYSQTLHLQCDWFLLHSLSTNFWGNVRRIPIVIFTLFWYDGFEDTLQSLISHVCLLPPYFKHIFDYTRNVLVNNHSTHCKSKMMSVYFHCNMVHTQLFRSIWSVHDKWICVGKNKSVDRRC